MAKKAQFIWQNKAMPDSERIQQLKEDAEVSLPFATLCVQRGITTKAQLDNFLTPRLEQLHDPFLMHDMQKGVERIRLAIEQGERILVYGDYDADGITSTTILVEAIEQLGGDVHFYLPNRFTDGYGPNREVFKYMIEVEHTQLIVTCDNGVAGHEAIQWAMEVGVDVIVTDHHELPDTLPNAYAIIHPRHPEGQYPFGDLSGAGVAFKVACALLEDIPMESLDIVAIGTVADLVSLTDENRVLVHYGVDMLKQTQRIGLIRLMESLEIATQTIDADTIGFSIAPRLNALGRLDDATPGVELMITFDEQDADTLVALLEEKNNERKTIVQHIIQDIEQRLTVPYPNAIVLADEKWHAGVLGIVASQIVEKTGKPTVLLQIDSEKQIAKGSGRSVEAVNLYDLLSANKELFSAFGGHHMAAGLSLPVEKVDILRQRLEQVVPDDTQQLLTYDMVIQSVDCTLDFIREIEKLSPFGTGNARPLFLLEHAHVTQTRAIGANQQHLKGTCNNLDFIYFNAKAVVPYFEDGVKADFIVRLGINAWNGLERAQCQVVDTRINGVQFFDRRSTQIRVSDTTIKQALYVFFDRKYYDYFHDKLDPTSRAVLYQGIQPQTVDNLVLFDCPTSLEQLKAILATITYHNVYICAHVIKSAYLIGAPTRQQFAQLYKIIYNKSDFSVKDKLEQLERATQLTRDQLILMLQVFVEVGVVTIEQGILNYQEVPDKKNLEQTHVYQTHLEKIAVEKLLVYTQFKALSEQLKNYVSKEDE